MYNQRQHAERFAESQVITTAGSLNLTQTSLKPVHIGIFYTFLTVTIVVSCLMIDNNLGLFPMSYIYNLVLPFGIGGIKAKHTRHGTEDSTRSRTRPTTQQTEGVQSRIVTDAAKVPYLGPNGPRGTQP
jgi:hypothetical protein